ncbi:hypothetical protein BCR34DRAFT_499052, partial [Clohesyomyces aquaticus]
NLAQVNRMNRIIMPKLQTITPRAAAYLSEANFANRTWKQDLYDGDCSELQAIKAKYDVIELFYSPKIVGSEA